MTPTDAATWRGHLTAFATFRATTLANLLPVAFTITESSDASFRVTHASGWHLLVQLIDLGGNVRATSSTGHVQTLRMTSADAVILSRNIVTLQ